MTANFSPNIEKRNVRLKGIALPIEHGSWGFLFEPLLAGLLIAPSGKSIWLTLLVIGAFLTRQPLKVYLMDWQAKRNLPQTKLAIKFTLIFGEIFLFGLIGSIILVSFVNLIPFLLILPLAIYQIYSDATKQSRQLFPELTGSVAISSSIAVIALANNLGFASAFVL